MIEELKNENLRLKKAVTELSILNDVATQISSLKSVDQIISAIVEKCRKHIGVEQAAVMLLKKEQENDPLQTMIRKVDLDESGTLPLRLNTQLIGWILKTNKPLIVNDLQNDARFKGCCEELSSIRSLIGAPLLNKGKIIGVLTVFNKKNDQPFNDDDKRLLSIISSQSAQIIENARLLEEEKALMAVREELRMARELQLSLLPKEVPQLPNLEIAVYMQTATEVGGDYYDFSTKKDGSLNIAIGDATGHGMKAGTLVSMMKSLFTANSVDKSIIDFFSSSNVALKKANMERMMIGFAMLTIKGHSAEFINAGLPPVYHFKKSENKIDELNSHSLPLGAMTINNYNVTEIDLNQGDVLLMMTDGFPELQNDKDELYGYRRTISTFELSAEKSPNDIIDYLKNEGLRWVNGKDPDDDVTFVVIKVK